MIGTLRIQTTLQCKQKTIIGTKREKIQLLERIFGFAIVPIIGTGLYIRIKSYNSKYRGRIPFGIHKSARVNHIFKVLAKDKRSPVIVYIICI